MDLQKIQKPLIQTGLIFLGKFLTDKIGKGRETKTTAVLKGVVGITGAVVIPNTYAKAFSLGVALDGAEDGYVVYSKGGNSSSSTNVGGLA